MGHNTQFLQKFQLYPWCSRWILYCKTLIFDFWECTLWDKLWTCEWTLGVPLSILNHILKHWLNLRWKFPPGGFSQSKTLILIVEVLETQMSCTCAIFCLIFVDRDPLIHVATLRCWGSSQLLIGPLPECLGRNPNVDTTEQTFHLVFQRWVSDA